MSMGRQDLTPERTRACTHLQNLALGEGCVLVEVFGQLLHDADEEPESLLLAHVTQHDCDQEGHALGAAQRE